MTPKPTDNSKWGDNLERSLEALTHDARHAMVYSAAHQVMQHVGIQTRTWEPTTVAPTNTIRRRWAMRHWKFDEISSSHPIQLGEEQTKAFTAGAVYKYAKVSEVRTGKAKLGPLLAGELRLSPVEGIRSTMKIEYLLGDETAENLLPMSGYHSIPDQRNHFAPLRFPMLYEALGEIADTAGLELAIATFDMA